MQFTLWHLLAAYAVDLAVGDPRWLPHPVRAIGKLIERLERVFYAEADPPEARRRAGIFLWVAVIAATAGVAFLFLGVCAAVHPWAWHAGAVWLAATALATRSLHSESRSVARALRRGDLPAARSLVSRLVSRDPSALDERGVTRALVETVAENISDGIVAPLFFLALGGPVLAVVYKAVNTLDSMVGYLNDRYRDFGWFSARADDWANLLPARLSGLAVVVGAGASGLDWRSAFRVMRRDANKMKSPNAGWPEAAAAGALGVQLGGANVYFGEVVEKPTLGDPSRPLTAAVYNDAVRLLYAASGAALLFAAAIRAALT